MAFRSGYQGTRSKYNLPGMTPYDPSGDFMPPQAPVVGQYYQRNSDWLSQYLPIDQIRAEMKAVNDPTWATADEATLRKRFGEIVKSRDVMCQKNQTDPEADLRIAEIAKNKTYNEFAYENPQAQQGIYTSYRNQTGGAPNFQRYLAQSFPEMMAQYQAYVAPTVKGGQYPPIGIGDFLANVYDPMKAFQSLSPTARGENPQAYTPFTRFINR